jgi:hypothetical protein
MANNEETVLMGAGTTNNSQKQSVPPRPNIPPLPNTGAQARPQQPPRPAYQPVSDDSQTWKRVAIGGVAGILFGTVSAVGATAAYHHFANNDEPQPETDDVPVMPEEDGHYTMENGLQVAEVSDDMSFSEAFAAARAEVGPGGVFVWHGGVYGTYYETEWNSMSAAERNEFAQLSQPAIEQEAPIHHQPHDDVDVVYHDPEVRIHNTSNDISQNDDDVQIVGVEEVTLADGSTATMAQANVDGHDVYMVDVDQDGVFDVAAMDVNGNGQLDDNEIMDISSQGVTMNGTASTVSNDGMSGMDDGMMVDASMSGDDGMMPDYTNDVDGDILV